MILWKPNPPNSQPTKGGMGTISHHIEQIDPLPFSTNKGRGGYVRSLENQPLPILNQQSGGYVRTISRNFTFPFFINQGGDGYLRSQGYGSPSLLSQRRGGWVRMISRKLTPPFQTNTRGVVKFNDMETEPRHSPWGDVNLQSRFNRTLPCSQPTKWGVRSFNLREMESPTFELTKGWDDR